MELNIIGKTIISIHINFSERILSLIFSDNTIAEIHGCGFSYQGDIIQKKIINFEITYPEMGMLIDHRKSNLSIENYKSLLIFVSNTNSPEDQLRLSFEGEIKMSV